MRSFDLPATSGQSQPASDTALRMRHVDLIEQHHDLDYMISALSCSAACDELLVARLKKRKLRIKDEIIRVERGLHVTGDSAAYP
jgi:hypothetical protein